MQPTSPDPAVEPPASKPVPAVVERCRRLISNPIFETAIVIVIVINATMLGLETFDSVVAGYHGVFDVLYNVILAVYVIELLIRFTAAGWDVREFSKSHWNVFDFFVIAVSFLPGLRATAMLLRLVRLARIVCIIRFLPDLRVVIGAIARSIPGVASLAAATALLIYIYGMLGWVLFADHDPDHYGNIGRAMLTMYIMLTLENLPDNVEMGLRITLVGAVFHQLHRHLELSGVQPVHRHRAELHGGGTGDRPCQARDGRPAAPFACGARSARGRRAGVAAFAS